MSPEELFEAAINDYPYGPATIEARRAEFRQALLERDVAVIEEYVYGSENSSEGWLGFTDSEPDNRKEVGSRTGPYRRPEGLTAGAKWRAGM